MDILISGAGIAGSTLALCLSKLGHTVTVIEKAPFLSTQGQNVDVKGSSLTAMKRLGLMDRVREMHSTEIGTQFVNAAGEPYASFPQNGSAGSPTAEHEIMRGDLAKILYDAASAQNNVTYLFDTSITTVVTNDEKSATVQLSDGSVRSFDLVVAADGHHSKLRSMVFTELNDVDMVDLDFYAAYWTMPRLPEDNRWWNIYFAGGSRLVHTRPEPHGTTRAMLTCLPSSEKQKTLWRSMARASVGEQQAMLRREFSDAGWQAQRCLKSMTDAKDFYFQACQQVKMKTWSRGRVICLGDAAYAPTPLTGAGVTLAVTGAYCLAGELGQCLPTDDTNRWDFARLRSTLESYEARFKPWVELQQKIVPLLPRAFHPEGMFDTLFVQGFTIGLSWVLPWLGSGSGSAESDDDGFALPEFAVLDAAAAARCKVIAMQSEQVGGSILSEVSLRLRPTQCDVKEE